MNDKEPDPPPKLTDFDVWSVQAEIEAKGIPADGGIGLFGLHDPENV